jgi:hydrogen peroxide-dependent heme synthase
MNPDLFPPLVLDGWFVLHQFFRVDPLAQEDDLEGGFRGRTEVLADFLSRWSEPPEDDAERGGRGWSGLYRIVGGGTDYMLMHFRPTLDALGDAERELRRSPVARDLIPTGDYVSVVELGLYAVTDALLEQAREEGVEPGTAEWNARVERVMEDERSKRYVQARLRPLQPADMPYVCFYPMDKRRNVDQNWYTLPVAERAALMGDHGQTGRRYAGRISQVISGSVGLDDWEWAVTLFSQDPLTFKALVTEMRYDPVSSVYAEFGNFWVGHRIPTGKVVDEVAGAPDEG